MKKMAFFSSILLGYLALLNSNATGQGLYQVSMDEKINASSLIIEGRVADQKTFWNGTHTMIYTTSQVEVYKLFKGTLQQSFVEITTVGGVVDNSYIEASHQLKLEKNDIGVFFCRKDKLVPTTPGSSETPLEVYSSSQGFLKFGELKSATAPFVHYKNIAKILYPELKKKAGKFIEVKRGSLIQGIWKSKDTDTIPIVMENPKPGNAAQTVSPVRSTGIAAPVITSFSPLTANAGAIMDPANNVLTINGSGFGAVPSGSAAVHFDDADDGINGNFTVLPYNSPNIVSWNDSEIKVRVPTKAGTGLFKVADAAGTLVNSPSNLIIGYSILSAVYMGYIKQLNLVDFDGNGGYTILYSNNTANSGQDISASLAKATFQRALNTWKECSGLNVTEGGTDMTQQVNADDYKCMIMFDNSATGMAPLPSGVLATCYSKAGICPDNAALNQWIKTEFDIVIRNTGYSTGTIAFTLGPCPPLAYSYTEVDLEAVLLHELGHGINLGHINEPKQGSGYGLTNPGKVMNYGVSYTFKRTSLDYSSRSAADYMINPPHVNVYGTCAVGLTDMIPTATIIESKDECPPVFPVTATPLYTLAHFDLVHATSNKFTDPAYNQVTTDGSGISITNTAYFPLRTSGSPSNLSLEVTGYATEPAAQAACTEMFAGIPVTGVQVSVYQVSGCPVGGAFPTPVAYTTFKSDGVIPSLSGLLANTNYLMVLDGIENTKATFNLSMSLIALPAHITEFSGKGLGRFHYLSWVSELAFDDRELQLQRSSDGISYRQLSPLFLSSDKKTGHFTDKDPLPGNNYYRLAMTGINGTMLYSKLIVLNTDKVTEIDVYANPADRSIQLGLRNGSTGKYAVNIYNSSGQLVLEKMIVATNGNVNEKIQVSTLPEGIYHLSIFGPDRARIKSATIKL